jgi:hypothetical protein
MGQYFPLRQSGNFVPQLPEVHDPFALLSHESYARESGLDSRQDEGLDLVPVTVYNPLPSPT